eukprot:g29931.t1
MCLPQVRCSTCRLVEELPGLFWLVMGGSTAFSVAFFYVLLGGVRRYHHLQRKHLFEVQSLRCALDSLDEAYYEVRRKSALSLTEAEDAPSGVTKVELMETLKKAGIFAPNQDVLWEAMDTNQDGVLSAAELGLVERPRSGVPASSEAAYGHHRLGSEASALRAPREKSKLTDLIQWGAKIFSPPGGTFGADKDYCHIGISELQYLLLKCCLLFGVTVELGVEFRDVVVRSGGWVAETEPPLAA